MRNAVISDKPPLALLAGALAAVWAASAVAKPACTPVIERPDNGALEVSVTPEVVIDPNRKKKCHIKRTEVQIETVDGGKPVIDKTISHEKGLSASGPLPRLKVPVPAGELERNTAYRLEVVQYPPEHIGYFHEGIGTHLDRAAFVTEGGVRQRLVISSRHRSGATDYSVEARKGARYLTGNVDGIDVTRQANDRDLGNRVTGRVGTGADGVYLRGGIARLELADPTAASLFLDGAVADAIVIDGSQGAPGRTSYTLETDGSIDQIAGKIGAHGISEQSDDAVRGQRARGHVASGNDGLLVAGRLTTVDLGSPERAGLHVNGRPAHTVVIDGRDQPGETDYSFAAAHRVEKIAARVHGRDVSIQGNDRIKDHRRVAGTVAGGADGYLALGDISHDDVSLADPSAAAVYIDGARAKVDFDEQAPDPDTGAGPDFDLADPGLDPGTGAAGANTLVIDGRAVPSKRTTYNFRSNKPVSKADGKIGRFTVTADKADTARGNEISGSVGGGLDGYRLEGAIREMTVRDLSAARFYFNGDRSDHTLVIDGTKRAGASSRYTVRVSGTAQKSGGTLDGMAVSADGGDKIRETAQRGTVIEGAVGGGRDGFRVLGEVLDVDLKQPGAAKVYLDGNPYRP
jgi:hypothetical protein